MQWIDIINKEKQKDYFKKIDDFLDIQYSTKDIYPPKNKLFQTFNLLDYNNLKVVLLGQDPYHQKNQACGLAFSTPKDIKNPPSLQNIIKEIKSDIKICNCQDGDLTHWVAQGVMLLNTILSVEDSKPNSHKDIGWEIFSNNILKHINDNFSNIIFILLGSYAMKKGKLINSSKHHILNAPHPSPLSVYRGFFGSKIFSQTNNILKSLNKKEIVW